MNSEWRTHNPLRMLMFLVVGLIAMVVVLKVGLKMREPQLAPGDRTEERSCRQCGGQGKDDEQAKQYPELGSRCSFCAGSGKVAVVLPGPNHPALVVGVLVDEEKTTSEDEFYLWRAERTGENFTNPAPKDGVLAKGHVKFQGKVTKEVETGGHGLITVKLPPGQYEVTASREGYDTMHGQLEVAPFTEPIWLERAKMGSMPGSADQARAAFGQQILVTLAKSGAGQGRMVVSAESAPTP